MIDGVAMIAPRTEERSPNPAPLLLEALEKRWKKYRLELKHCRVEFSNEAVHDVRIALRRLLSLIELLNSIAPRPRLRKLSRAFKNQLDDFDDLRDTQEMLAEISETIHELPQLQRLKDHLERVEMGLLKHLRKEIKRLDLKEITRRVRKTREKLKDESNADLVEPILQSVDDAFQVILQRHELADSSLPASIHRVRITFKTFRYMVEIVHPLLDGFPEENLKRMHEYQSMMGEIQDLEIMLQTLDDVSSVDTANAGSFEPVRQYYKERHADAISAYLKDKDVLNHFWRPSPKQPFPGRRPNETLSCTSCHCRGCWNGLRRRQSAPAHRKGTRENAEDRTRPQDFGRKPRLDRFKPVRTRQSDGGRSGKSLQVQGGDHL